MPIQSTGLVAQNVLTQEVLRMVLLAVASYFGGLAVRYRNVRANYTRKIIHFIQFGSPFIFQPFFPFEHTWWTSVITLTFLLGYLFVVLEPVRSRIPFFDICFSAVDRPEDRPYTLTWLITQTLATYAVIFPMAYWLRQYDLESMFLIAILVTGLGDGLAEPVGVYFGRHKYPVRLLFTSTQYFRSLEGSFCVWLVAFIVIVCLRDSFTSGVEFYLALAAIPLAMTLAEAVSPHTWDAPLLYFAGGSSVIAVHQLARAISGA